MLVHLRACDEGRLCGRGAVLDKSIEKYFRKKIFRKDTEKIIIILLL